MKKIILLLGLLPCAVYAGDYWCDYYNPSYATSSYSGGTIVCPNTSAYTYDLAKNCATKEYNCFPVDDTAAYSINGQDVAVIGCNTCSSGYTRKFVLSGDNTICTYVWYYTCELEEDESDLTETECTDTAWSDYSVGYQRMYKRVYSGGTCTNFQSLYRCASGYYGIQSGGSINMSGCSVCPDATGMYIDSGLDEIATVSNGYIYSVPGSNEDDTGCFLKAATYYDASGLWSYTGICYQDGSFTSVAGGDSSSGVDCSTVVGVCAASSGTAGTIVSGTKTEAGGTNCWCNVADKSFYLANQSSYCANACDSACTSWVTNDTNSVATNLGCE